LILNYPQVHFSGLELLAKNLISWLFVCLGIEQQVQIQKVANNTYIRAMRFNKVPNIKPELVGRLSRPTNSIKSGMALYLHARP
jgi:hypothetical protein